MSTDHFDVAVVGGGPAGSTVAIELSRAGIRTVLLERTSYGDPSADESISPRCRADIDAVGIAIEMGVSRCPGIVSTWGSPDEVERSFLLEPFGDGWNVDRRVFHRRLADRARLDGAVVRLDETVIDVRRERSHWIIDTSAASRHARMSAAIVADASGRRATVVRRLGARRAWADHLVAELRVFGSESAGVTDARIAVEAAPWGWVYAVSGGGKRQSVVRVTDADLARVVFRSWEDTLSHARRAISRCCGQLPVSTVVLPAGSAALESAAGIGWLAVGDAALAHDPLSGSGVAFAVRSARRAAAVIRAYLSGDLRAWASYAVWVREEAESYRRDRCAYYRLERRWEDEPFWRRRHSAP